jgi:predicted phosphodiesterase
MRIAVVSDIHGNLTALKAVLKDLRETAPDVIFHGGDLAASGSRPAEIVDCIRDLGWLGVVGNADELLFAPESLEAFARQSTAPPAIWSAVREMAAATRAALGAERLAWLRGLPGVQVYGSMALVHASPKSCWVAPGPEASDAALEAVYGPLGRPVAVYGHIHSAYIRSGPAMTVVNTGSVSLSYDGDPRAAYLLLDDFLLDDFLLDDSKPVIRRVEYDVDREIKTLVDGDFPHAGWLARMLKSARPEMP